MNSWLALLTLAVQLAHASPGVQSSRPRVDVGGEVSVLATSVPRQGAAGLRPEVALDVSLDVARGVRARADVTVTGLLARRGGSGETALTARARDVWVEVAGRRAELRVGYGQLVWGRLDELQPTDVINPIDASRFLFDGRSTARLPVAFVRSRVFVSDDLILEGVFVPWFRRGVFDELDEDTSPFNLVREQLVLPDAPGAVAPLARREPDARWANVSGGGRVQATFGRVDVSAVAFRGFDAFGPIVFEPALPSASGLTVPGTFVERHERFTMVGGDVETVVGEWAWRGEVAAFVRRKIAGVSRPGLVDGHMVEAGLGVDRRLGGARVYGAVFGRREWSAEDVEAGRSDLNLIGSFDRSFRRERYQVRVFGLVNPADRSGFLRGLLSWRLRDNVTLDVSAGTFVGAGDDTVGQFDNRDFVFGRLKYYF